MIILDLLNSIPFFSTLSYEDHLSLIENIRLHYYPAGHLIFKEGDAAINMFIIRSGKIRIFKKVADYEHTIAVLSTNDFFGEMALVNNLPRNACAQVLEECELFSIHKSDLYDLLQKKPDIAHTISKIFIQRTKELEQDI